MSKAPIPLNPLVDRDEAATTLAAAAAVSRLLAEIDQSSLSPPARAAMTLVSAMVADALDYERHRIDRAVPVVASG